MKYFRSTYKGYSTNQISVMYGNGTIWYQLEESNPMLNLNPLNNKCLLNSSQKNDTYVSKVENPYAVKVDDFISRREQFQVILNKILKNEEI